MRMHMHMHIRPLPNVSEHRLLQRESQVLFRHQQLAKLPVAVPCARSHARIIAWSSELEPRHGEEESILRTLPQALHAHT